jgi:hypothetical protein
MDLTNCSTVLQRVAVGSRWKAEVTLRLGEASSRNNRIEDLRLVNRPFRMALSDLVYGTASTAIS